MERGGAAIPEGFSAESSNLGNLAGTPQVPAAMRCGSETDAGTFAQALVRELPRLRRYVDRGPARAAESDDVLQETILRALERRSSFDGGRALWPWLRRVAETTRIRRLEREGRQPDADVTVAEVATARQTAAFVDERDSAAQLLDRLRAPERRAIEAHYLRGESVADIAKSERVPTGTVKSRLSRARRRLALLAATVAGVALAITAVRLAAPSKPALGEVHFSSFTIDRTEPEAPALRRVDRTRSTPKWTVQGAILASATNPNLPDFTVTER